MNKTTYMRRIYSLFGLYICCLTILFAQKSHLSFTESNGSYVKDMKKVLGLIAKQKYDKAYLELKDLRDESDNEHIKHSEVV